MFKEFVIVVVAIVLFMAGIFYYQNKQLDTSPYIAIQEQANESISKKCIRNPGPVFTANITDLSKIERIIPPGSVVANGDGSSILKTHSFLNVRLSERVPVYAPADSSLFAGVFYEEQERPQYILFFRVSCEVFFVFDHLDEIEPIIKEKFPETPQKDTMLNSEFKEQVSVKAGELIGYTEGTPQAHSLGFGVYNESKPNFLNDIEEYEGYNPNPRDKIADCPYDYFAEDTRAEYAQLFEGIADEGSYPKLFCK